MAILFLKDLNSSAIDPTAISEVLDYYPPDDFIFKCKYLREGRIRVRYLDSGLSLKYNDILKYRYDLNRIIATRPKSYKIIQWLFNLHTRLMYPWYTRSK